MTSRCYVTIENLPRIRQAICDFIKFILQTVDTFQTLIMPPVVWNGQLTKFVLKFGLLLLIGNINTFHEYNITLVIMDFIFGCFNNIVVVIISIDNRIWTSIDVL